MIWRVYEHSEDGRYYHDEVYQSEDAAHAEVLSYREARNYRESAAIKRCVRDGYVDPGMGPADCGGPVVYGYEEFDK